jgi:hypothetical protein
MQFSADFVALHTHQSDVHRAERELERRNEGTDDAVAPAEPVRRRHRRTHRAPRLALR